MKIKDGFMLRGLGTQYVVVPLGNRSKEFKGMIRLNQVGAFLWKLLSQCKEGISVDAAVQAILDKYDVDEETAAKGVKTFLAKLQGADLLEN